MKLKSIAITNFRQFWKEVKIDFSCDSDKNITVIHGANGAGKTSLLNAFKWCFYGKTDFDTNTDHILNESAIQTAAIGQDIELRVTVVFEEQGLSYEVTRSSRYRKNGEMDVERLNLNEFNIMKIDETGSAARLDAPKSEINRILPETLQPYFFFNGERIEKLAGVNESEQIKEAIKKLMGLKQIERAQRHLGEVAKRFRKETAQNQNGNQGLVEQVEHIERVESDLEHKTDLQQRLQSKLKVVESGIAEVDKKLASYAKIESLQQRRREIDDNNKTIETDLELNISERKALLDNYRSVLIAKPIIEKCQSLVHENRKKGILPYKVRSQFIDDLLESCECLCGRHIDEASKAALEKARHQAGSDDLEAAYVSVTTFLNAFESMKGRYTDGVKKLTDQNKRLLDRRAKNSLVLSEISVELQNSDDQKVAGIECRRKELEQEKLDCLFELRRLASELPELERELESLKKEWNKQQQLMDSHSLTSKRLESTHNVHAALEKLNAFFTEKVRADLSNRVSETFGNIIRKNMHAYIDSDFMLRVEKQSAVGSFDAKEQSTGEKQVTSLSFISSIISLAKEKHASGGKFFKGGLYPLVMDSPFGALDDDYRFKVAQNISLLADQVIIFVSNSQWNGNVKQACEHKVGSCYKLVHFTNSDAAKQAEHHDFLRYTEQATEYSSLEEVAL